MSRFFMRGSEVEPQSIKGLGEIAIIDGGIFSPSQGNCPAKNRRPVDEQKIFQGAYEFPGDKSE